MFQLLTYDLLVFGVYRDTYQLLQINSVYPASVCPSADGRQRVYGCISRGQGVSGDIRPLGPDEPL